MKTTTKSEIIGKIDSVISSCEEGYSGEWDCTTDEGKEGFSAMIVLLEEVRNYVNAKI